MSAFFRSSGVRPALSMCSHRARRNDITQSPKVSGKLHQFDDPSRGLGVRLDVALSGGQVRVTGEGLNVPQGPADRRDPAGGVGDEGPSPAVAGIAIEAEFFLFVARSVVITKGDGRPWYNDRRRSERADLSSLLRGTTRPPVFPLLASFVRWMDVPISPSEVVTMSHVRLAISFALSPDLIDNSRINRFRAG
jgi:hypothetical protein